MEKPIYDATRYGPYSTLKWADQMRVAFGEIKGRVANAVALSIPNMEQEFVLVTDFSNIAAGAMLAQEVNDGSNQLIPCAFYHHDVSKSESKYRKRTAAIVLAVKKFKVNLGKKVQAHHRPSSPAMVVIIESRE